MRSKAIASCLVCLLICLFVELCPAMTITETGMGEDPNTYGFVPQGVGPFVAMRFDVNLDQDEINVFNFLAIGNNDAKMTGREYIETYTGLEWDAPDVWQSITIQRDENNAWLLRVNEGSVGVPFGSTMATILGDLGWIDDNSDFLTFNRAFLYYRSSENPLDTTAYYRFSGFTTQYWSPFSALTVDGEVIVGEVSQTVPLPGTVLMLSSGLLCLLGIRRHKEK